MLRVVTSPTASAFVSSLGTVPPDACAWSQTGYYFVYIAFLIQCL
jgi:hypothetical protein